MAAMPITPPETIRDMSAVFVDICEALQLKVGDDPATRIVAERIIDARPARRARRRHAARDGAERIRCRPIAPRPPSRHVVSVRGRFEPERDRLVAQGLLMPR